MFRLSSICGAALAAVCAASVFATTVAAQNATTDIGTLGRLFVLRGFADAAELAAERKRALFSANPFGAAEVLTGLEMDSYAPFPFLPPVVIDPLAISFAALLARSFCAAEAVGLSDSTPTDR